MFDFAGIDRQSRRVALFRAALVLIGLTALAVAAAFIFRWSPITRYWPFPAYGLTNIFLASIFAAIGAPIVWIGLSGEFAALRGGALNILITSGGAAAYSLWRSWSAPASPMQIFGVMNLTGAMVAFLLVFVSSRLSWSEDRPMPWLVRLGFIKFAIVLTIVGGALLFNLNVFPWPLERDTSAIYGFFFLGAATYFTMGLLRPLWANAKGQLIGFLAYDLVLIVPFLQLWPVAPSISLAIYLAVIVTSALLAIYYLILSPKWRLRPR